MNRCILIPILLFVLTSCAVKNPYQEPTSTSRTHLATIQGYDRKVSFHYWQWAKIQEIDNKEVATQWGPNVTAIKIPVKPGKHNFTVYSAFNDGFLSGPFNGITQMNATLSAGHAYHLNGELQGKNLAIWIEDEYGKKITSIKFVDYKRHQEPLALLPVRVTR